ncbi:NAD(P)/FAD-dependent oxidoreductase [Buttiauxella sp. WJP83]|uniref:NAD(P)/FAD-dependent oxidoreductase n=1 Tax=Buttiauxella sp. WJP83 TaxID=2986951 RepID=UPI0022DD2DF7|nr:NAD(P)/FAD-dependent oxidoreductase [Buttiauxella sp. WJP83]WBM69337.1 NAD(P)/FAD-dependent oxidoreductase [Buttiauxella sp. WJP83]
MKKLNVDVVVIGAGVVGCAVTRRFVLEGARVLLIEKSSDILSGASKANSAILHTGFDAPPDSTELSCMQRGYREYLEISGQLNLPILKTGAVVAAWNQDEMERLPGIMAQAKQNGVADVQMLDRASLLKREPFLSPEVLGGLLVPEEHVIDPWSAPLAYLRQAVENGGQVMCDTELLSAIREGNEWVLTTNQGEIRASTVINCAGVWGDKVESILLGTSRFTIKPRKGQFVVFDKVASSLLNTILLPVPNERTKGVVLVRTIFGNLLVGPTAEEQDDRLHAAVEKPMLEQLIAKAVSLIPALSGVPVTAVYAGLRPATERKEYRIYHDADVGYLAAGGIRSTGLTASLGLAAHLFDLYSTQPSTTLTPLFDPVANAVPNLAEHLPRDWQMPGSHEMVCHCERVTRREIDAALNGPVPARDLGGLKRRTRVCMGRCQGFYCSSRVAELSREKWGESLIVGDVNE